MSPSKGTPVRKVRIVDEVWDPVMAKAAAEGTTASVVTRWGLELFLAAPPREWPQVEPGMALKAPEDQ